MYVYTTESSISTRFPEYPALSSFNNNNNKKGWRPVLIRGSACLTWLTRRALGRRTESGGRAKWDEKGGKMRGGCCHFRCLSYQRAERGLISSPLRRKMGLNLGFYSRFVPPSNLLFSLSLFFSVLPSSDHHRLRRSTLRCYSTVRAWKMPFSPLLPDLIFVVAISQATADSTILLRNINVQLFASSGWS